jgi:hypothetical protein
VVLERGSLSFVSTTEGLLERTSRGSGLENREYGRRGFMALTTRQPLLSGKVGTNFANGRSRTEATELVYLTNRDDPQINPDY